LEQYLSQVRNYDPVLDGLRSAVRYDKTYFDKIVASLLPLLEKLTSGKIAQLLAPNYSDLNDPRPIFDWMQIIRKRAVVYVGLDALSDAEVAAAVGNSMFSDLVSVAGHIYKHGIDDGLPGASANTKIPVNLHADEFNELMGDEFIPMINKGGGAGIQVTAYTQTLSAPRPGRSLAISTTCLCCACAKPPRLNCSPSNCRRLRFTRRPLSAAQPTVPTYAAQPISRQTPRTESACPACR